MKQHSGKLILALIIILIGGAYAYSSYTGKKANEGVVIEAHVKGNPDAETTLVEYSDFECPACAQFYPIIKDILDEHGESLRFEYRHFPLMTIHPNAVLAAKAAEAAGQQGKFFEMHDALFENQPEWSKSPAPIRSFEAYAERIGLDLPTFKRHMNSTLIADTVQEGFDDARSRGFSSTPSFLLNGEPMEYTTYDEFIAQIEAAIGIPEEVEDAPTE